MKLLACTILAITVLRADVQYYLTDKLTSIDSSKWTQVGTVSAATTGLSAPAVTGGSLISKIKAPDGSSEVEIRAVLTLVASGGVYTEFVQATSDAHTGSQGSGSYLALEMQNPTFDGTGHCLANYSLLQSVAGTVYAVASFQHGCRNGMELRLAVNGTTALVWPDQATPIEFPISPASGQPGIGAYGTPAGNAFSLVQLGSIGRGKPAGLSNGSIGFTAFRNRTDVQWRPIAVDASSPGLAGYFIYRDGQYLMRTTATHFSDEAVAPGANHVYTIYAVDQHYNLSPGASVTVITPTPKSK